MRTLVIIAIYFSVLKISNCENNELNLENIAKNGIDFNNVANLIRLSATSANISIGCKDQINYLYNYNSDALFQTSDAWSKFPYPGAFYYASKIDYGNYDECLAVNVEQENQTILGKYCPWGFVLPDIRPDQKIPFWLLAYCVPDKCTANDLNSVLNLNLPLFNENYCSSKDTDSNIDTGAIIAMAIFGTLFFCTLASTFYDTYLHYAEKETLHSALIAFSLYTNGKILLKTVDGSKARDQILCFHGMKFISMWWIITGHSFISSYLAPVADSDFRANWQTQRYAQYISSAHICVDTFFFISGFLMAYLYFKRDVKAVKGQIRDVPLLILHRYLRITPANGMCFLGAVYLFKYFHNGPFFSYAIHDGLIKPCKKYWWTYFLYIQNYYNFSLKESLCIPTTWYLSADMQLFLITPLILIPVSIIYKRSFRNTMALLLAANLLFLVIPIFTKLFWRDYDPDFQEYDFHSKLISYFIGVMMGLYMRHEKNKNLNISRTNNLIFWFFALGTMLAVIFYRQDIQMRNEYVSRSLCYSFTRPMWCISLAWITYACANGYGGIVNWFLSSSFMQIGGKLTYSLYIIHGMVIAHYSLGIKTQQYFTDWNVVHQSFAYFVVSMLIASFWSLSYEIPMITIEKLIFGRDKPKAPKVNKSAIN